VNRIWLWPNLLSLDAPLVAVLWQILFARCFRAPLDAVAVALLLLTVWLIYVADRTLDAWKGDCRSPRHEFYRRHWRNLLPVWLAVLGLAAWLAMERLSPRLFLRGTVLLAAVAVYFGLIHLGQRRGDLGRRNLLLGRQHLLLGRRRLLLGCGRWPKEAVVGVLFALGASLVAWGQVKTPADVATILLFSGLCWMNCVAIEKWEAGQPDWSPRAAALWLAGVAGVLLYAHRPVLGGAELSSAVAFLLLGRARPRLSANAARVLADVALLSPVLFLSAAR